MKMRKLLNFLLCVAMVIPNVTMPAHAATNLAYGKPTFASSMYDEAGNYSPEKVTDGDLGNIWSMGSIPLKGSRGGVDQYIAVDLGEAYMLDSIVAETRRYLDDENARSGWYAQVANDEYFTDAVTIRAGYSTVPYEGNYKFVCDFSVPYRYVRICSPAYFTVAEIEVFGEKYDPTTMNRKVIFSDTDGEFYQPGAMLLSALGIMTGISKTEFAGERILTRAQAARIITAFAQVEIKKSDKQIFDDVALDHWAADYIHTAAAEGIISADKNFRPDDYVTDKEFLKLVLYAMGYGEFVELSGGWNNGVYDVANSLDLTKRAGVTKYENLSRGSAAMILYNALNTPLLKEVMYEENGARHIRKADETMLESNFGLTIITGQMTENSTTSLVRPTSLGSGIVKIDNRAYHEPDQIMEFWLGRNVGVAVDVDTKTQIFAAWLDTRKTETIRVYDFQRIDEGMNHYQYEDENERIKNLRLSDEMFLVKNNSAIIDWTERDLVCPDGYIDFVDNDGDGKYDVAMCFEPRLLIVTHASNDGGKVNIVSTDGTKVHGENLNYLSITKNGKNTTAGRIAEDEVVKAYQSPCGKSLWLDVGGEQRTVQVGSVNDEDAELDGDVIEFTEFYKNNKLKTTALTPGKTLTVILDNMGRIVWVMSGSGEDAEEVIAYIIKIRNLSEFSDESLSFKVFTQYGTFKTYYTSDKVIVDGRRNTTEKLRERISTGELNIIGEFAVFKTNKEGQVTYIDTEEDNGDRESKVIPVTDKKGNKVSYKAFTGTFGNIHNYPAGEGIYENTYLQQPLKRDTLAFTIPVDEDGNPVEDGYEDFYKVSTAEETWRTLEQILDRSEFYGLDKNNYPTFGVMYKTYAARAEEGIRAVDYNDAEGMVVTKVKTSVNSDNELIKKIHGYSIDSGREIVISTDGSITKFIEIGRIQQERSDWVNGQTKYLQLPTPADIKDANMQAQIFATYCKDISQLNKGDVILYQLVGDTINSLERVFSINDVDFSTYQSFNGSYYTSGSRGSYPETIGANFKLMYGKVRGIDSGIIKYENVPESVGGGRFPMQIPYTKMSAVFIVEDGKVKMDSASNLPAHMDIGDEMVVHTATGNFRSAIIYK